MTGRRFHLAVGQPPAGLSTPAERLAWLAGVLPSVTARAADLLVLPELFATGYNIGSLVVDRAEPADGPFARAVAALCKSHRIAVHYGYAEICGETLYNAAQCFGPDGTRLGHHRKLVIPPGFEQTYFTPGQGCSLFSFRRVRIATLICYDAEFPEAARHVACAGAELLLVPTALAAQWDWVARCMIPTRAYENGVYLAYANSAGVDNGLAFLGQSFVATPDGQDAVRAGTDDGIIHAVLELERVAAAQARLPYLADWQRLRLAPMV